VTVASDEIFFHSANNTRLANLRGQFDENIKLIESGVDVEIGSRGNSFFCSGTETLVECAKQILCNLYELAASRPVRADDVHLEIRNAGADEPGMLVPDQSIQAGKSLIKARGANQKRYLSAIKSYDISFGVGPAGTGKTYLAVAAAVDALEHDRVRRICLVRPAVEAGERLGFLPGDMKEKVDPYLRPLYDALYELFGADKIDKKIETGEIEIAPLAFMRGRTLKNSFAILDEAQNATDTQIKMFLTRIGENSKIVINGDPSQIDLPNKTMSGLNKSKKLLSHLNEISVVDFDHSDVVRHPLVSKIVKAYSNQND